MSAHTGQFGGQTVINHAVASVNQYNVGAGGFMEFTADVGVGSTVTLRGTNATPAQLRLDDPTDFKGGVNFSKSIVDLANLAGAHDWNIQGSTLSIYAANSSTSHNKVIDRLTIADNSGLPYNGGSNLQLFQQAGDVFVTEHGQSAPYGATLMLMHPHT